MQKPSKNIIIIRRPRRAHAGHHGGAWKVAYADFVTAMMAFFLVMWLTAQNPSVKSAVAGYFRDPGVFTSEHSRSIIPAGEAGPVKGKNPLDAQPVKDSLSAEQKVLSSAADRIKSDLMKVPDVASLRDQIEFTITAEGLRIELVDRAGSSFFDSGSSVLRGESARILGVIAGEVGKLQNDIVVEGHTDSRPYSKEAPYTNWELSADRANAARRVMEAEGLRAGQLRAVRGFADTQIHIVNQPTDPRNRRVSIVVRSHAAAALDAAVRDPGSGDTGGTAGAAGVG
jgi:chemotaxis protein MotB